MYLICDDDIIIRNFVNSDVNDLYEVLSDTEVMKFLEPAFSLEQTIQFLKTAGFVSEPLVYAVFSKAYKKVIGHCIFHKYDLNTYELGWVLHKRFWHKGIASLITEKIIEYSKNKNIKALIIECVNSQQATKKIALKFGFELIDSKNNLNVYKLSL